MGIIMILIFLTVLAIFGGIHYYIGLRGWQFISTHTTMINAKVYWVLFSLVAVAYIIGRFGRQRLPRGINNFLTEVGSYWWGVLTYCLIMLLLVDLFRYISKTTGFLSSRLATPTSSIIVGVIMISGIISLLVLGSWNAKNHRVVEYNVNISKSAGDMEQLKVVMVSDLHLGHLVNRKSLEKMVDAIKDLDPDIVLMPGDIVDDDIFSFREQNMVEVFQRLNPRLGIYASMGNHDYMGGEALEVEEKLRKAGINVLRDEAVLIENSFYIVGREDKSSERFIKKSRKTLEEILIGVDKALPIIMLDHQPTSLNEAREQGIDLQVSGHTHKGQLAPFHLITKRIFEIDHGLLKTEDYHIVVTSGYGTWGPPMRIGSRSEIVKITVNFR